MSTCGASRRQQVRGRKTQVGHVTLTVAWLLGTSAPSRRRDRKRCHVHAGIIELRGRDQDVLYSQSCED